MNLKTKLKCSMKELKEHRIFRNQIIAITIICFASGWFVPELLGFGVFFALLSIWNIYSYRQNKKDFEKLNKL